MKYLYDLIFLLFSIAYIPYMLIKRKALKNFKERLGFLPQHLKGRNEDTIWVHAVSVGEVMAAESFIRRLKEAFPSDRVVISTTTETGNETAKKIFGNSIPRFYFPLDFHFVIDKTLSFIDPKAFILFETEIWPNLVTALHSRRIPVFLANGRISDRSFGGYKVIKFAIAGILRKIDVFLMQTEEDADRIKSLGARPESVRVCGNVKYDVTRDKKSDRVETRNQSTEYRERMGIREDEELLICGSTHNGEEEILLKAYKELSAEYPNLRLLIAPRHIDRVPDIENLCRRYDFEPQRVSRISLPLAPCPLPPILILDTIGHLAELFSAATIVFMGGSFVKKGGHNLVEPAVFAKPILFGPYMNNFRDMARQFLKNNAAIMVKDENELIKNIQAVLNKKIDAAGMGGRARGLVEKNMGAVSRMVEEIKKKIA